MVQHVLICIENTKTFVQLDRILLLSYNSNYLKKEKRIHMQDRRRNGLVLHKIHLQILNAAATG